MTAKICCLQVCVYRKSLQAWQRTPCVRVFSSLEIITGLAAKGLISLMTSVNTGHSANKTSVADTAASVLKLLAQRATGIDVNY